MNKTLQNTCKIIQNHTDLRRLQNDQKTMYNNVLSIISRVITYSTLSHIKCVTAVLWVDIYIVCKRVSESSTCDEMSKNCVS